MPPGEEMFKYHGYSGPCPAPPTPSADRRDPRDDEIAVLRQQLAEARELAEKMEAEVATWRRVLDEQHVANWTNLDAMTLDPETAIRTLLERALDMDRDTFRAALNTERAKRFGTCRWWSKTALDRTVGQCDSHVSECGTVRRPCTEWFTWSADHGCPHHERVESVSHLRIDAAVCPYDPNCLHCRRDAGKDFAGVTRLCEAHKDAQLAAFQPYLKDGETPIERLERERHDNDTLLTQLAHSKRDTEAARSDRDRFQHDLAEAREKLAEREATVDILVQRVHERDAELGELKQSGKTERRFTNDYIKALHKAERDLRAKDIADRSWQEVVAERDAEIERLRALLTAVAESGVEWRSPGYVSVQIDQATWSAINTWSAITAARKPVQAPISAVSGFDFPPEAS